MVFDRETLRTLSRIDFSRYRDTAFLANYVNKIINIHNDTLLTGVAGIWINTKTLSNKKISLSTLDSSYRGIDGLFIDSRNNIILKKALRNIFYFRQAGEKNYRMIDYRTDLSRIGGVTSIAEDIAGNLWFCGLGMMRLNHLSNKFDICLDSFPSLRFRYNNISTNLIIDKNDKMYFGVGASGLITYDPAAKIFSQHTRSDGLPDNNLLALYLHKNTLWMVTQTGLANFNLETKKISSFSDADGIPTEPHFTYSLYYDSAYQQLYGAFKNTIFRFNPDSLKKNNIPPEFFIESLVSGKETIHHPPQKIDLSYKSNSFVINTASVNFEDAYQQQFAYRIIENGNEPWQETGTQQSIIFSNLSPGKYRFQVKTYIRNNSWQEQIEEILITIHPPFWKTIWFIAGIALGLTAVLIYLYKRRISGIKQKANLDKLLAQTEMKVLHSQMNPHFIFNCLNSIREMILSNENRQASHYLSKFAQLIRITLDNSTKPFISLQNTIDYLQRYLEMEKIRTDHFKYSFDIDKELELQNTFLPPMLIQPFIENAIWHGQKQGEDLYLMIKFLKKDDELICIVDDNGVGIESSQKNNDGLHHSFGIANIKQRIQLLNEKYNLKSVILVQDKSTLLPKISSGTKVTLHLPIKTVAQ